MKISVAKLAFLGSVDPPLLMPGMTKLKAVAHLGMVEMDYSKQIDFSCPRSRRILAPLDIKGGSWQL
jgi:hypothetical protein